MIKTATGSFQLAGKYLIERDGCPYIDTVEDFDLLKSIKVLPELFLKASKVGAVKYNNSREHGFYTYGKASAKLFSTEKDHYYLEVETSFWKGISDMETLQEKIQAGTIMPSVSYEKKQVKNHLLATLGQILDSRNLNKIQRFCLALRLMKKK